MVVGSFSSVSLDPPLVAFFPDRTSSSWAKLRDCPRFCVNILSADQEDVCRRLASKDPDKFAGVTHAISTHGSPVLDGAVAWIDCDQYAVTDAGDHEMVTGRVLDLGIGAGGLPLLFFRGGYGRFAPATMVADQEQGITLPQLRDVDCARTEMERLAARVGGICIATVRVGDELVIAASAGQSQQRGTATLVGQRLPFVPPTGAVFGAWLPEPERSRWIGQGSVASVDGPQRATLDEIRDRGFSIGLRNDAQRAFSERLQMAAEGREHRPDVEDLLTELAYDPVELSIEARRDIRLISAPVLNPDDSVALALTIYAFSKPEEKNGIDRYIEVVVSAAEKISRNLRTEGNS